MSDKNLLIFDLASKFDLSQGINKAVFPLLHQAVEAVAAATAKRWIKAVGNAKLSPGEKKLYIDSIDFKMTGDFTAVVEAKYDKALEIENGRPARDLKWMLGTSKKVRITKTGRRYLYIPFRHNTPGNNATGPDMPSDIYKLAKKLTTSQVIGSTQRPSGQHFSSEMVPQSIYQWGGRLQAGLRPKLAAHHSVDIYAGMVKMKANTGGSKRSVYLTFRTMAEGSPKWIVPAQPGQEIAKKVEQEMQPLALGAFEEAIKRTLAGKT